MPSGAKKRKAAKKKKESHNNFNKPTNANSNYPQGNDDPRSQDERDSDGGEASSPVSQDHQPSFREESRETGNEEGSKEVSVEDNTVIKIERDFSEKDTESKILVEHVESAKEAYGEDNSGSSSSSSSSSSDDESHYHREKWNEEAANTKLTTFLSSSEEKTAATYSDDAPQCFEKEKPLVEPNGNTAVEAIPPVDTFTPVVPLSEVGERLMESSEVQGAEVLEVLEPAVQLNDGITFPKYDGVTAVSADAVTQEKNVDKVSPTLEDNDGQQASKAETSLAINTATQEQNDDKVSPTLEEDVGQQSSKAETSPAINGSENKTLASSNLAVETSINADTVNNSRTFIDLPGENKDEELPTSNVQIAPSIDVAPKAKDSGSHEYTTEDQPLIAPAPRVAQRTSWMSCCGILDVFAGSGR